MRLALAVLVAAAATDPAPAPGKMTWYVDANPATSGSGTRNDPYASIQYALSRPSTLAGDMVLVLPGTYRELVDLLGKDVILASTDGPAVTTIDATGLFSVEQSAVKIRSGEGPTCTLSGFTIRGGDGTAIVEPVLGSTFFVGGGVLLIGGSVVIRDCIIAGNAGEFGGGIYADRSRLTLERCTIEDNESHYFGAGIHLHDSDATLSDVAIHGNVASTNDGGGIHMLGGSLVARHVLLDGNFASVGGNGSNVALSQGASLKMSDVVVRGGRTLDGNGGGLWADASSIELERCSFEQNSAGDGASNREGGALFLSNGTLAIRHSVFTANASSRGGAVYLLRSTATIRTTVFAGNTIRSGLEYFLTEGGALAASESATTLSVCAFRDNTAVSDSPYAFGPIAQGGAVWCDTPTLDIRDCLFRRNHAFYDGRTDGSLSKPEPGAQGGAVFGPAFVRHALFIENRATSNPRVLIGRAEGGAIFGATQVSASSFIANEVRGVGPVPDRGPAAETTALKCCNFDRNLPAQLPTLGPNCSSLPCD